MKSRCKVSVLVAVYNSELYVGKCLDSLCRQTITDIQIIAVDDGSTDHSLDILRRYEAMDQRIEVVELAVNCGQAHARNIALQQARGEYICFLDSDDWMADDALEEAVRVFSQHPRTGCVLFHTLYYYVVKKSRRIQGHKAQGLPAANNRAHTQSQQYSASNALRRDSRNRSYSSSAIII